jgi:hypothetical protein
VITSLNGPSPGLGRLIFGQSFEINVEGADLAGVRLALVRLGSTTHGNNMDQRYLWLGVQQVGASQNAIGVRSVRLRARAPEHGSIAPPGDYMLIVVDRFGVTSPHQLIQIAIP